MSSEIAIDVFHDERLLTKGGWLYHGMLFVPVDQEDWLIDELIRMRSGYDGFVHFKELTNPAAHTPEGRKTTVAKNWVQFFVNDTRFTRRISQYNNFCFAILGIDLKKINRESFGNNPDQSIFNRFFRTSLSSGIELFYRPTFDIVNVNRVFHARQNLSNENLLQWHPLWRIEHDSDRRTVFGQSRLSLLAADHRLESVFPRQSQLIQFVDVVLGAFSQCFDFSSKKRGCTEVAVELQELAEKLAKNPRNKNSRFHRKYKISFFPSRLLSLDELGTIERYRSTFYSLRELRIRRRNQTSFAFALD